MARRSFPSRAVVPYLLFAALSCDAAPKGRSKPDAALFAPTAMRIHPIFTQPKAWTNATAKANAYDGIEALVELTDPFGDPTKAGGKVIFELYALRQHFPDPRGERLTLQPWVFDLRTVAEQKEHWRRIGSAYSFRLPFPVVSGKSYVLTAQFELAGDTPDQPGGAGRFFDQIVVEVPHAGKAPTTRP